ncbi:Predicted dithiol-disulfide isomerase, DsbA family [Frankineae bacterium MT45]|nr:Predicted dithiol-disulfide isomerase, DsbA family [Frankineae bacterium MT45]
MKVEIWSDIACPWCYVGKRRFEEALTSFDDGGEPVVIEWKSFELDPGTVSASPGGDADYADRLARKFGASRAQALKMLDSMTATAAEVGLDFHFEKAVAANTFDAHQLVHLGRDRGLQQEVKDRLLRAHFSEGEAVGDREALIRLGVEAGLDADEARSALTDQRYAAAVRADEAEAAELGVSGVPFFVIDRRYGISGAQPAGVFLDALNRAQADSRQLTMVSSGSASGGSASGGSASGTLADETGEACGPDGCAV